MKPPLETVEQQEVVEYLELHNILFSAPAQNTWTPSYNQKRKNHKLGVRPGLPDLMIYINSDQSADGESYILHIEMKRAKKSLTKVSDDQWRWYKAINSIKSFNIQAYICYGAAEAKKVINHYLYNDKTEAF